MPTILTTKQVNGLITKVKNMGKKYDQLVHDTGVQCLLHAQEHGDVRLMMRLIEALGKGYRAKGLQVWVEKYSPLAFNGDGKIGIRKEDTKNYVPFNVEEADATPFWTMPEAEERTAKPLTLEGLHKIVLAFSKQVDKVESGERELGENESIEEITEYVQRLQAVQTA